LSIKKHIEKKNLPYTPEQMFVLVAEVDRYHEFAPWCIASRINARESDFIFYADLVVGYKMLRERFSSKVYLEPPTPEADGRIFIEYLRGPLRHLKNYWRFIREPDGSCTIDFSVEFEFKNSMLQGLSQVFFQEIVRRMVGAFEKRAREIYGG
jgi:coenzyme Q-binding protein COQ10